MCMKRELTLALLFLATCGVVSAQVRGIPPSVTSFGPGRGPTPGIPASITSMGPNGFGGFRTCVNCFGFGFGHRGPFGFRDGRFHHHSFPWTTGAYGFYPYYGAIWPDYGMISGDYGNSAYQQPQPTQPMVVMVDPSAAANRYGDHSFEEPALPVPQPALASTPSPPEEQDPTVLVFRDGHKQEVRNYAIVGTTLWDFGARGAARKIPLSDIDIDATRKANDDRGVEFILPKS